MAVLLEELNVLQVVYSVYRAVAAGEVVSQTKGVANLVRRYKADEFSHEFGRKLHLPGHRI